MGSIPSLAAIGARIGARMTIAAGVSSTEPIKRKRMLTNRKKMNLSSAHARMYAAATWGICPADITQAAQTTLDTASKAVQRRGFGPLVPGVHHIPYAYCYRCVYGKQPETCAVECAKVIEEQLVKTILPAEETAAEQARKEAEAVAAARRAVAGALAEIKAAFFKAQTTRRIDILSNALHAGVTVVG